MFGGGHMRPPAHLFEEAQRVAWDLGSHGDRVCASDVREEIAASSRLADTFAEFAAANGWGWLEDVAFPAHAWSRAGTCYVCERRGGGVESLYRLHRTDSPRGPERGVGSSPPGASIGTLFPGARE